MNGKKPNLKCGQRWLFNSGSERHAGLNTCLVEILPDNTSGVCIQVIIHVKDDNLVGFVFSGIQSNWACWEYLEGQDKPQ